MKLSRSFVSDYIDLDKDLSIKEIARDMTNVGNEYDTAGPLIECSNLIVGEVIECDPHPDSDHLHVCKVNIGKEVLNIVCGAPNVRKNLKVIVALSGAKLPGGEIKKGVIRGVESNGMICSLAELGLDNKFLDAKDKEGIHEFPDDVPIGSDPIKALDLDDEVIDFELTSNRGDLLSILGMAYELGAIYKKKVKDIEIDYKEIDEKIDDEFAVKVKTEGCSLFLAKKVKGVTIKESPNFIKKRLVASGIRPINNVVDISNYVMLETGQPLHFYDADKLGDTIIVRDGEKNEKLITLDNVERNLTEEDIVIADKKSAVGLAGVMGGLSTEVTETTKDIIIEAAIFDNIRIRKTAKKILRSEASNRFEKGIDPKRTYLAIERSATLLEKYADAKIVAGEIIYDNTTNKDKKIEITIEKINKVLGIDIAKEEVVEIFKNLGFTTEEKEDKLLVFVPSRRLDIEIVEDLIEEVGRIHGMDKIVGKQPNLSITVGKYDYTKREIRHKMASFGLNETMSFSLIPEDEVHKFTKDNFEPVKLNDPMSEEKDTLRYSLLYSLKEIYSYNKSYGAKDVTIFEMGKGFYKENNEYKEDLKLACLMSGDYYIDIPNRKVDFYTIKGIVENLLDYLGYSNRYSFVVDENIPAELHPGVSASIVLQGKNIGIIGKIHPNIVKDEVFVFEINLDKLLENRTGKITYKDIPKYPSVEKDLAFIVSKNVKALDIINIIKKGSSKILKDVSVFDIYEGDKIASDKKSIAFNLVFADQNRTLTDEEVMEEFNKIIDKVTKTIDAELRNN